MLECPLCGEPIDDDGCAMCATCSACCECEPDDDFDNDELGVDPEEV